MAKKPTSVAHVRSTADRGPSRPLEGEDLATTRWEDARHWMSIYADLLEFKRGILGQAWADHALYPEEVRNYVRRLRRILAGLEIPADVVNKPGRGYSLVFRDQ